MQPLLEATQAEEACELVQESSRDVVTTFRRPLPGDCPLTGALLGVDARLLVAELQTGCSTAQTPVLSAGSFEPGTLTSPGRFPRI
jgi:hypothetical protein